MAEYQPEELGKRQRRGTFRSDFVSGEKEVSKAITHAVRQMNRKNYGLFSRDIEQGKELSKEFSIDDWSGYPDGNPPPGPFKLVGGSLYGERRESADRANASLHKEKPEIYGGLEIHEIHPVKFNGDPQDEKNKIGLESKEHSLYTTFWNRKQKELEDAGIWND